jgi:PEP-CTERM motif
MKWVVAIILFAHSFPVSAQGTFQNLDFESADLTPIPNGQTGGFVPFNDALPGWTGYIGTVQQTQVQQNNSYLARPSSTFLDRTGDPRGQNFQTFGVISGDYTVCLQSGGNLNTSIEQTGTVPANAESLQFEALGTGFQVSLGGFILTPVPLSSFDGVTTYGANISQFASKTDQLELTALASAGASVEFDNIVFSPTATVPEPSPLALAGIGSVLFALYRRFAVKRS